MFKNNDILMRVENTDLPILKTNPTKFWENIENIGTLGFSLCSDLKSIKVPGKIVSIGQFAFSGCRNLEKIELSEGLKIIDIGAFSSCKNLEEITIPSSVEKLGDHLFTCCDSLKKVTIKNKNKLPEGLDKAFSLDNAFVGFDFNSFEIKGDEVTFIRNVENKNFDEKE